MDSGSPIDLCVVEGAPIKTTSTDLGLGADCGGAIGAARAAFAVGVEDVLKTFPLAQLPLRINVHVFVPYTIVALVVSILGWVLVVFIVLPLASIHDAVRKACLECPILCDVLEHCREVEGGGVKDTLLCGAEEILRADIDDVQHSCCKLLVDTQHLAVSRLVFLDVFQDTCNHYDYVTQPLENDAEDVEAMIDMVLEFVDGHRDEDLLLGEAADVVAVNATAAIGGLQG